MLAVGYWWYIGAQFLICCSKERGRKRCLKPKSKNGNMEGSIRNYVLLFDNQTGRIILGISKIGGYNCDLGRGEMTLRIFGGCDNPFLPAFRSAFCAPERCGLYPVSDNIWPSVPLDCKSS